MFLVLLEIVLLVVTGVILGYLCWLSILALLMRNQEIPGINPVRRFAVVIPAHNEETGIEQTLRSLSAVDYPRELYTLIVIADNCTDRTAEKARACGATVYERFDQTHRGKGYVLRWAFDLLLPQHPEYHAYVVVDADSVVSGNFLRVMDHYIGKGSEAVQSSDMVAPNPGAWSSEVTRLGFTLYNHVRPLGRKRMHCPAGIRGNGMCFSSGVLRRVPWSTYSLNEDLEYGLLLLLHGILVDFAPEAVVRATMPVKTRQAESQRARWEGGRFPIIRRYGPVLLAQAVKKNSFRCFDAFVDLITPPFVNIFGFAGMLAMANLGLLWAGVASAGMYVILWFVVLLFGFLHVVLGLIAAGADPGLYRALFYIPRYALWKVYLYRKVLYRGWSKEWIRTSRDQVLTHPGNE